MHFSSKYHVNQTYKASYLNFSLPVLCVGPEPLCLPFLALPQAAPVSQEGCALWVAAQLASGWIQVAGWGRWAGRLWELGRRVSEKQPEYFPFPLCPAAGDVTRQKLHLFHDLSSSRMVIP